MREFIARVSEGESSLSDKVKTFPFKKIESSFVNTKIKKDGKQQEIAMQRGMLEKLLSLSSSNKTDIIIERALCYSLAPISMPLSNSDGTIQKTSKTALFQVTMNDLKIVEPQSLPGSEDLNLYFTDLAAAIRTIFISNFGTIRQLAWNIVGSVPQQYSTVYIICDTCRDKSIKA